MNFNQFKNLPRIKDLPIQEQNRQWFLYQGNLMYEARSSAIATAASSAAGGRRSTPQPAITFYGLALYTAPLQYKLNGITETGEQVENPFNLTFNGITVFEKNTDDNYNYFITYDNETTMTFGKLKDGNITIIDTTNLSALTNNAPGSLYYEGGSSFVYLDGCPPAGGLLSYTQSNIIRIDTAGNCEFIVENVDISSIEPTSIFPFDGNIWATGILAGAFSGIGLFDLETGTFIEFDTFEVVGLPAEITNYKVLFVLGSEVVNDEVYLNLLITDKDTSSPFQCIAKLATGEEGVYTTYVSPIDFDETSSIIFDITLL